MPEPTPGKMDNYFAASQMNAVKIIDPFLRAAVIGAAKTIETAADKNELYPSLEEWTTKQKAPWGLEIECSYVPGKDSLPALFIFKYHVNKNTLRSWYQKHEYLLSGALSFTGLGIQLIFDGRLSSRAEKTMFGIERDPDKENPDSTMWLPLLIDYVTFTARRDVVSGDEWHVHRIR